MASISAPRSGAAFQVGGGTLRARDRDSIATVDAVVTVLLPEFEQVEVETGDGRSLAITERTKGVSWASLRIGDKLSCQVRGTLTPEVVSACALG